MSVYHDVIKLRFDPFNISGRSHIAPIINENYNITLDSRIARAFLVMELTIATCGTVLNMAIMVTVLLSKQLRGSNSSIFIVSLSVSDLLVCSFVMSLNALNTHGVLKFKQTRFGSVLCHMFSSLFIVSLSSSAFNVVAISIDRYICIGDPGHYYSKVSRFKLGIALVSIWLASVSMAVIPMLSGAVTQFQEDKPGKWDGRCTRTINGRYQLALVVVVVLLPCIIITSVYAKIFYWAYTHIRASQLPPSCTEKSKTTTTSPSIAFNLDLALPKSSITLPTSLSNDDSYEPYRSVNRNIRMSLKSTFITRIGTSNCKATMMLSVIVGGFLLHWLPYGISSIISIFNADLISPLARRGLLWLLMLNSLWNPLIYSISNSMYTNTAFQKVKWHWCRCCKNLKSTTEDRTTEDRPTSLMFPELAEFDWASSSMIGQPPPNSAVDCPPAVIEMEC